MARDQVFISYSHADSEWLERLQTMLAPLQRQGALDVWADTRIQPGQLWKEEIQKALARAKVAVLLVSPDFLASEFIHKDELPPLLEASSKEGVTILWVPVRPSLYKATTIAHFQAAHDPKTPLSMLPLAQQEAELVRIAEKLIAIRPLPALSPPPPPTLESTSTPPAAEQVAQPPSPSSSSPSLPSLVTPSQRVWRQLLIVLVLGVVGGAGVYHLGKVWFEKKSVPTSSVSRDSAQRNGTAESTEPKKSTSTVSSPSQQATGAKAPSLPPVQNIHGWTTQQVQDLQTQTAQALKMKVEFRDNLKDGGQGPLMVVIPSGRFQMGSPATELGRNEDERQHEVKVGVFAMGKYAVTFEEYDRFAEATGREKPADNGWGRGRRPVINVSWNDAVAYTDWISKQTGQTYRLPTEAEWEYAARAGTTTPFYFGETINTDQANYNGNYTYGNERKGVYRQQTVEVGQFPANTWGLHDMHGNIWEWTCSLYDKDYGGSEQHCAESGTSSPCVLRGGSWTTEPQWVRGATHIARLPRTRSGDGGFRLARTFSL
jgi:formylglycine-generating enzyme required for sulfatase activity